MQELEAMPRLVWPQEASEALSGHRHPQMQTQLGHDFWYTRTPCDPAVSVVSSLGSVVRNRQKHQTLAVRQVFFTSCPEISTDR